MADELEQNEQEEDVNDQVEEEIDDADIITVPIDTTLTHSGEAADAKTVGDILATKADKSEIQATITVNGKSKDANNNIKVIAVDIPYANSGEMTVKSKLDEIDSKTADDIPMTTGENPQTVAEAIEYATSKTADMIPMEEGEIETVYDRFASVEDHFDTVEESISANADDIDDLESDVADLQTDLADELTTEEVNALVDACFTEGGE